MRPNVKPYVMIETAKRIFGRDKAAFAEPDRFDVVRVDFDQPVSQALRFDRNGEDFTVGFWSDETQTFTLSRS